MNAARALTLASLAAALLLPAGLCWAGPGADEALRQLELGRADLVRGDSVRAIHAAHSARVLDPTRVESFLLEARAHEQQGNLDRARTLALVYRTAAGAGGAEDAQTLIDRIDRAAPVRAAVAHGNDGGLVATFSARGFLEDPTLHWRAGGVWRSTWMEQNAEGEWFATVELKGTAVPGLRWWVEPRLGQAILEDSGKDKGRPFLLALH